MYDGRSERGERVVLKNSERIYGEWEFSVLVKNLALLILKARYDLSGRGGLNGLFGWFTKSGNAWMMKGVLCLANMNTEYRRKPLRLGAFQSSPPRSSRCVRLGR